MEEEFKQMKLVDGRKESDSGMSILCFSKVFRIVPVYTDVVLSGLSVVNYCARYQI